MWNPHLISEHSTMERLTILVGRLYKYVGPTKYFFKVKLVGRFMALLGLWNPCLKWGFHMATKFGENAGRFGVLLPRYTRQIVAI